MSKLELKIPPLLLVVILGALMWLFSRMMPTLNYSFGYSGVLSIVLVAIGIGVAMAGVITFRRAETTVNPIDPGDTSSLVRHGIYQFSRNSMYLGFLLWLTDWASYLSNPATFLCLPGFVLYMNRFQIGPEEKILGALFREEFEMYKHQSRRWI